MVDNPLLMKHFGKKLEFLGWFNNYNLFYRFGACRFASIDKDAQEDAGNNGNQYKSVNVTTTPNFSNSIFLRLGFTKKISLQFWELRRPVGKERKLKEYQANFEFS